MALNGLRADAVKWEAVSDQQSAKPLYRKGRKGRQEEM